MVSGATPNIHGSGKGRSLIPNFGIGRFNSVVPSDALNLNQKNSNDYSMGGAAGAEALPQASGQNMLNLPGQDATPSRSRARRLSGFENLEQSQSASNNREQ